MATEENVNPTEGQEQENDYRETLLVRNPDSGQVEAVSKLVTKGDRREVHTVQPLAKNRPAFYPFRSSNAVAAFIRGFKSQKDNPIQFQFLKVPVFSVGKIVTSLGKLVSNPKSEEGWETYNKYVVNTAELEQVKYDKVEIPRAELQELGIDFDALPQRTQRSLMLGLPTRELFPATVQLSNHGTTTGLFNLSFYRDHNDELKFRLDTPLVQPEYEREEYASEITPDDKALLARGKTLQHLVTVHNSITGEAERCHVAFNPSTNRLVAGGGGGSAPRCQDPGVRRGTSHRRCRTKNPSQRRLDPSGRMHGLRRYGEHLQGHPELRCLSGPLYDQRSGLRQAVRP